MKGFGPAVQAVANQQGLVVIDVVEGTALPTLPHMATVLRQRPHSFPSPEAAVHWARMSGELAQPVTPTAPHLPAPCLHPCMHAHRQLHRFPAYCELSRLLQG